MLALEHVEIDDDMISQTLRNMLQETDTRHVPTSKLVSNLRDKTRYVTHYRCLQFYLAHRLKLIHIHRIVAFDQRPFMRPFIEYCNDQRKKATTDFESGLYKLFANGKTVENVRKRMNAKLVTDPQKMVRAAGKATFKRREVINSDLVLVETERTKITLSKPVAIGFTILEFAKLVMYEFYYDCLLPKFGNKLHLCFTDIDSFICHIETPDLFAPRILRSEIKNVLAADSVDRYVFVLRQGVYGQMASRNVRDFFASADGTRNVRVERFARRTDKSKVLRART